MTFANCPVDFYSAKDFILCDRQNLLDQVEIKLILTNFYRYSMSLVLIIRLMGAHHQNRVTKMDIPFLCKSGTGRKIKIFTVFTESRK